MKRRLAWLVALAAFGGMLTSSSATFAQGKQACLAATEEGQNLRDQGRLNAAKAQFQICSAKPCGAAVAKQCTEWMAEVEKDQPTVLFRAKDAAGKEVVDVKILVDGQPVAESIPAQPLPLDASEHAIRFERAGAVAEDKVVLRVGEKARVIELAFPAAAEKRSEPAPVTPPPPEKKGFRIPTLGWVGGGVFVAGAATTVLFAVMANGDESDLRSRCAPSCAEADRDAIKTKLIVANVGLFVGIAGLALAGVTTILANRRETTGVHVGLSANGIGGSF
jgi:hypothetical protein